MVINLYESKRVKVNYDTLNELYIVVEAEGTTTCSTAEVLLHQYRFEGDVNDHRARKFTPEEMVNVAVTSAINDHQNQVELFKGVVI
jgi:hypothetical protein